MKRLGLVLGLFAACGVPTPAEDFCLATRQQAMSRVCQGAVVVTGTDVSVYQGAVDWAQVRDGGQEFAIARVSDGTTHRDSQFAANWNGMRRVGLVRGVYQFFRPGQDAVAQANLLLDQVNAAGGFAADDLPAVLDVESADSQTDSVVRTQMQRWLDRVEEATNKRPIIYTAGYMNGTLGTGFSKYPLWVANYNVSCPTVPDSWTSWRFWQFSSTGTLSGITGQVDLDRFNGSATQLRALARQVVDAGAPPTDAGVADAGQPDAGEVDAGPADAGASDSGVDAGEVDAGRDAGTPDAGRPEPMDAGRADAGVDAGRPEPLDAGATMGSLRPIFECR